MNAPPDLPPALNLPRFFWRRVLALFVDWAIVAFVTTLLLLPFLRPDETGLRLAGAPLSFTTCQNVTQLSKELAGIVAPEVVASATLCEVRPFGIYNGRTLNMVYALNENRSGAVETSTKRTLSVSLNGQDEVVRVFTPQSMVTPFVLMILSAVFLARNRTTPGKRVAGLLIEGQGCAMCRELRRLAPFVVLGAVSFGSGVLPPEVLAQAPVWLLVGVAGLVFMAVFAFYIWPLIRWRGGMPYDRATGFQVVRAV